MGNRMTLTSSSSANEIEGDLRNSGVFLLPAENPRLRNTGDVGSDPDSLVVNSQSTELAGLLPTPGGVGTRPLWREKYLYLNQVVISFLNFAAERNASKPQCYCSFRLFSNEE